MTLENPTGYFLELLTHYTVVPGAQARRSTSTAPDWVKPGNIVSNGAFTDHRVDAQRAGRGGEEPRSSTTPPTSRSTRSIYYPDEDRNEVTKRFRAGEIDYVDDFASEQIDFLKRELPKETRIYPYLGTYYYPINLKKPPFDNPKVRRALYDGDRTHGDHRQGAQDRRAAGLRRRAAQDRRVRRPLRARLGQSAARRAPADGARSCWQEAGYGPDNPLKSTLSYNTSENHKRIAVAAQAMWKAIGVQAELVNREVKVHYDELKQNNFDVARAAWVADYNDPQNFLYLLETRTGAEQLRSVQQSRVRRADDGAGRLSAIRPSACDLMHKAEKIAIDADAWIPIYYYVSKALVSPKVQGYVDNTKHTHRSRWMSLEG